MEVFLIYVTQDSTPDSLLSVAHLLFECGHLSQASDVQKQNVVKLHKT